MPVATRPKLDRGAISRNVLNYLRRSQEPPRPTQLLRDMTTKNYLYSDIQSAVSALLEQRKIRLTPERFVVIHNRQTGGR
jgi:hypothetical protein